MSEVKPKQVKKPKQQPKPKVDKVAIKQAEQKKLAIAVAVSIYHYKWIAASVGIHVNTLMNWIEQDQDFCDQLDQSRATFIKTNMKRARPDFLLETSDRDTFGKQEKIELAGELNVALVKFVGDDEPDRDTSTQAV